jgi:5'-phosphate synthase pdxT subunit
MRIGVLALQGAFREHRLMLEPLGVEVREVRLPEHLDGLEGLIIPGGESTTMGKLAVEFDLMEPLRWMARSGFPIWGTCAGMILLAKDVGRDQPLIGGMDIVVERNAFGRQVDSFETMLDVPALADVSETTPPPPFPAVFIRAPIVREAGPGVEVLARLEDGRIVAVRQGRMLGTAFHPELSGDDRFHRYFLRMTART